MAHTPLELWLLDMLGPLDQLEPFGGRTETLAALDAWLTNPTAPPCALLTAEAGYGKSTLLAHWAHSHQTRSDALVILIPISARFRTARASSVFASLATSLAPCYSEPPSAPTLLPEQWQAVCRSYLQRSPAMDQPLVVILDGLEEAEEWQVSRALLPSSLPPGVRLLLSACTGPGEDESTWRARLGWEAQAHATCFHLAALTRAGIAEVLNRADRTPTPELVREMARLSAGDPLLVRLYSESLFNDAVSIEVRYCAPNALVWMASWTAGGCGRSSIGSTGATTPRRCGPNSSRYLTCSLL
jgi:hypothetical protein